MAQDKEIIRLEVDKDGLRLDKYLALALPEYSRETLKTWIKEGRTLLDGKPFKGSDKSVQGSLLEIDPPELKDNTLEAQAIPLDIIYEDSYLLVVNKPQGMVVHPGAGNPDNTLVNALLYHTGGALSQVTSQSRPGIVHRLDKDTSGLLVVAKTDEVHRLLAQAIRDRQVHRVYETIVHGFFKEDQGMIDAPMGRDSQDRIKMAVREDGKKARTYFRVLEPLKHGTYLRVKLDTGRTHQIRVHMRFIGHPVLGDPLYGYKDDQFGLKGQCLHARYLSFVHPVTGENMAFESPLPDWFKDTLKLLAYDPEREIAWPPVWPHETDDFAEAYLDEDDWDYEG